MLANQGWKLMSDHSLCARLLKAEYIPPTFFLNAPPCLNPSFYLEKYTGGKGNTERTKELYGGLGVELQQGLGRICGSL